MPISADAPLELTAYSWVPEAARGNVRCLRVRWACEEAGIAYRERLIDQRDKPASYFREQPWGQVPALRDDDIALFESGAILVHLGEKSARLLPLAPEPRAQAFSWLFAALATLEPVVSELTTVNFFARGEEWANLRRPSLEERAVERFDRLAEAISGREWLTDRFSIADIAMATVLRQADRHGLVAPRRVLATYLERALARAAFRTALADQLAAFDRCPA